MPSVLGFIIAGVIIGPSVLDIVDPEGPVINMRAEIGGLLFMFFVGFEIDLEEFKRSRSRSLAFGALTFLLPFIGGVVLGRLRGAGWNSALLIGSLISSHTLLAFPLLRRLGLAQHPTVLMAVGGTIFTDIASMLVLAVTASVHLAGFSWSFLGKEFLELAVFVVLVFYGAGSLARKAIIRYGETPELRVMILLFVIALCAEGARAINLEGIVGAFLVGIAVKRAVRGKFAVEQLEITAHAIFIPAFFLCAGFLVNFRLLWQTMLTRPGLVAGLLAALIIGKYLAAWLSGLAYGSNRAETALVWSISLPQMAATLATAVVAHHTVNRFGEPLLDQSYVNGVLFLVVASCVAGPILSERFAKRIQADPGRDQHANETLSSAPI
ncbi:cation:proton antiporter [Chthoniobacter flavus]|uniref:cation:proton antiporter n=1 Tax=Chthoniobacter flavus TaxID=191863 RepID=UPI002351C319|nr:cation:proton antiporter [Chthoniobacter flavus]